MKLETSCALGEPRHGTGQLYHVRGGCAPPRLARRDAEDHRGITKRQRGAADVESRLPVLHRGHLRQVRKRASRALTLGIVAPFRHCRSGQDLPPVHSWHGREIRGTVEWVFLPRHGESVGRYLLLLLRHSEITGPEASTPPGPHSRVGPVIRTAVPRTNNE